MQSKTMIAAAALASSTTALRLTKETTNLAQAYDACHGTYAYQCIEEKVDGALGLMTKEVYDHKEDCIETADNLREEIVDAVSQTRDNLEDTIDDLREEHADANLKKLREAMDAVEAATTTTVDNLNTEADDRVFGNGASAERTRIEGEIKKVYYADWSHDIEGQKVEIKKLVDEYKNHASSEGRSSFTGFVDT